MRTEAPSRAHTHARTNRHVTDSTFSGLGWTNFNLPFKLYGDPDSESPGSRRRRLGGGKVLAGRRQAGNGTAPDKCKIAKQSENELGQKWMSVFIGLAGAFKTRIVTRISGIISGDPETIQNAGGQTPGQILGFSWSPLADEATMFGVMEMPVINKQWQGMSESAAEAINSGCNEYVGWGFFSYGVQLATIGSIVYMIYKARAADPPLIVFRWSNLPYVAPHGMPYFQPAHEEDLKKAEQEKEQAKQEKAKQKEEDKKHLEALKNFNLQAEGDKLKRKAEQERQDFERLQREAQQSAMSATNAATRYVCVCVRGRAPERLCACGWVPFR